jgi:hypothetical protein
MEISYLGEVESDELPRSFPDRFLGRAKLSRVGGLTANYLVIEKAELRTPGTSNCAPKGR